MSRAFQLGELARRVGGEVRGNPERTIRGVNTLERAQEDELSFLTHPRYRRQAESTRAGAVLVAPGAVVEGHDLLEVAEPQQALAELLALFEPQLPREPGISPLAHVGRDVQVGENVSVGPFAVLEDEVRLGADVTVGAGAVVGRESSVGDGTELRPGVVLYPRTELGQRCIVHAGVVLGGDGYGYVTRDGKHRKVPQLGRLRVEDDVEVGANTTIDRGGLGDTRIGAGTKIDNLVMVAHNVDLGTGCLLAGQAGIAGSTRLGDGVVLAGQAGASGHLRIAGGTAVGAKSAVLSDVNEKGFITGIPAFDHREWLRVQAALRKLPDLLREVRALRRRVEQLEQELSRTRDEERS